jgi:hypothetical protein
MIRKAMFCLITGFLNLSMMQAQDVYLSDQLTSFAKAIIDHDYDMLVEFTPMATIEKSGGQFYKKEEFRNDKEIMDSQNMRYHDFSIHIDSPRFVSLNELQTIVEIQYVTTFGNAKFKTFVPILAISKDEGKNWSFVNLEKHDTQSILSFVPSYNKEMTFPEPKPAEPIR